MFRTGEISKVHGIRGEIVFLSDSGLPPEKDELLYIKIAGGRQLPHRVVSSRPAMAHGEDAFFVLFYGIDTRSKAEALKSAEVFSLSEPPAPETPEVFEDELFAELQQCEGYRIIDKAGGLEGRIEALEENPAHPLVQASFPDVPGAVLIPGVEAFIIAVKHDEELVYGQDLQLFVDLANSE
ncbi:MAG: ribosome maturation factor RimM [Cyclonatronaceae bacterium]